MSPIAIPTRITIDFRDVVHPSRSWILGLDAEPEARVELIAFAAASRGRDVTTPIAVLWADCACPDFCERDHANE